MTRLSNAIYVDAAQQPQWSDRKSLARVLEELRRRLPLVDAQSCHALGDELEFVARGDSFVVQAGECAELFEDSAPARMLAKNAQVNELRTIVASVGLRTVGIGRFAGQYAKPRSSALEILPDGTAVPVYRGDAVNGLAETKSARRADPLRLLAAYDNAARALSVLHSRPSPIDRDTVTYVSHEALLLGFERALARPDPVVGASYASSAHMVWVGDRTRQPDGAHVAFAESINNPIGIKIGPTAELSEVVGVVDRLAAGRRLGRLCLIVRLGVDAIGQRFPALITALGRTAGEVVWLSDPMHGNTIRTPDGQKTRTMTDILGEIEQFWDILRRHGRWPGGVHLEVTPDPVTECVSTHSEAIAGSAPRRFESPCDPRLNADQARTVMHCVAELIKAG
ncbi:3-deoxy-7-phosphoheptulonate synthase [Nocardia transvalensis]|uniref:3-deoxy-7-phosphoheptulonate synthase n=1 Tax=Nocardia transvalensis TaxID=37333 RepID=UPI0018953661|nr:3-deoxy-7-phosphoheptulonate synthase [Nocardia transvalensis]MBF6330400.1 3-deoxy-7-phosphoheptulonate synthase [Nocardia transvalensis]